MISKRVLTRVVGASLLLSLWMIPQAVRGDGGPNLYWDIPVGGPNGSWNSTDAFWSPNPGGGAPLEAWVNGRDAVFSATSLLATGDYTVTLDANLTVGDLTYRGGNLGSTLQIAVGAQNTLTMATSEMNVAVDDFTTLIVAPAIAGAGTLILHNGTLVLAGANTYSGGTTISGGTLQLGDGSATGSIVGAVANSGTFNIFNANTAGITTITNDTTGTTNFLNGSTAGIATITNNGGFTVFFNASTAGNAAITNNGGFTEFFDAATAGKAGITNNNGGFTEFFDNSRAGNATITNNSGGETEFNNTSTAGAATIVNNNHGVTNFNETSTAGNAVITNNGGFAVFNDSSSAGNATITTNSNGETRFFDTSTGGQARFITNAGATFDMSSLTSAGMTAGSIEGAGTYFLGSKALTVGLNNLSAVVSGTIVDGGFVDGIGGALIKVGTGTLALTGLNTYSGGTSFNGGIVAVNGDANLGTGPLSFNGGTLQTLAGGGGITSAKAITLNTLGGAFFANAGTTSSLHGAISGPGSLTKDGAGTLVLTGMNTYTGGTVLSAGTLTVDGPQAFGHGDVTLNGGILNADPQLINVKGNYFQNAGATLQLQVAGANPGQYDSLNVGGNAFLGGTLQLISLGFQPKAGNQLTLVTTGGLLAGPFARFVDPFATGSGYNTVELVYGRNSVLLEFLNIVTPVPPVIVTIDFSSFALTANQLVAANLLDAVQMDPRAANLISFLHQEAFANLPADFEKISPDGLTAFYEISFSNANIQRLNLESRMDDIRSGSTGFSSNMKINGAKVDEKAGVDGKSSKGVVEPILLPGPQNRWGVWVTGFGDFVKVDADTNAKGYDFTTGGVSLGIDYRITDQLAIGAMGGYAQTWTSLQPSGHIDVYNGRGGLYATWFDHGFYLDGAIYGGHSNYDSSRSGLRGLATGGTDGAECSTFASGGYDFHFGQLSVGPIADLQYTYVNVDGFSERGSLAPLQIHSGSAESLRSDVGFRLFYRWQIGSIEIEPSLKAAWEHEYKYSALPITAGLAGIPGPSATFFGPNEGHDSVVVSAGIAARLTAAISTYLNYDGQLGRENYDSNAVTGGVRIAF